MKILSLVRCIALFLGPLLFPMLSVIESAQAQTQGLPHVFLAGSDKKAAASRSATGVSSQPYVFGRGDFAVGKDPSSIATGDFNGDGILDLAVTNFTDNTVSVLLGKPDGTFAAQRTYSTGTGPVAVAVGDFNGDGNLDLVVANQNCASQSCSPSGVSILLGIGDGTFQPRTDYSTGTAPAAVGIGDFNDDGALDLAVVNTVDGTVAILLGKGNGTFRSAVSYGTGSGQALMPPSSIAIGDFNGDHRLDLAVSIGGTMVQILLGKGNGTFAKPTNLSWAPGGGPLATADLNQDGKLDLAIADNGSVDVYMGNGDGTFSLSAIYPTFSGEVVRIADFNGDGKLDLALSGQAPVDISNDGRFSVVSILMGNGDGTFQAATPYGTEFATLGLVAADFNGDGAVDLALTDVGSPANVSVLLGNGDGTFVAKMEVIPTTSGTYDTFSNFAEADFNKDGRLDLAIATSQADSVSLFLGNGDGTFQLPVSFATAPFPVWLVSGDFRNNGNSDVAVAAASCYSCTSTGSVSVLLGNGDGTFQPHVDYGVGVQPAVIVLGDFRGDGKLDLAVTNSQGVSILLGNGDGTFQPHVDFPVVQYPEAMVTGDFNRDGKLDIVSCSPTISGSFLSVLLGNGDGTFQPHVDTDIDPNGGACSAQWGNSTIATGDFNGDGKLDLAVYDAYYQAFVLILLGNGDGTFQPPIKIPVDSMSYLGSVVAADFNADGNLDLAVAGAYDGRTTLLLGNGDGTFQVSLYPLLLNAPSMVPLELFTVGDFNGDGVPDWALAQQQLPGQPLNQIWVMLGSFKAVYPSALNFGDQGVGTTSATRTLTISNPSAVPIGLNGVTTSGDFASNTNCAGTLKPGTNCSVNVTFSPNATGLAQGKITLTDTTRSSNQAIALTGAGVDGPFLTTYPRRLSFAPQIIGAKSPVALVTVVNSGNALASVSSINITGTNSSDFSQTSNCGSSLVLGGSCTVSVTFAPSAGGLRTARVSIRDSAPGSPQTVALYGFGSGLGLAIALGGSSSVTVSAGNAATYHLTIGGAGLSGSATLNCTGAPPGANCVLPKEVNVTTIASPLTVTVTTSSGSSAVLIPQDLNPPARFYLISLIVLASLPAATRGKRRVVRLGQSFAVFVILFSSSCGGGSTPRLSAHMGTYPLTVKATLGSISQSVSLTLVVN